MERILNQMVYPEEDLNRAFQALADPTRRRMLLALRERPCSMVELASPFKMSLPGAAKHLRVLERAKLITRRKQGRSYVCSVNHQVVKQVDQWLQEYLEVWSARLDQLAIELEKDKENQSE
ncbi:MAG: hypothetical protein Aurels2KO_21820 [Aureliella sp.]